VTRTHVVAICESFNGLNLTVVTVRVNGGEVAKGTVPISAPLMFTANDCLDIGTDLGSPVSLDYYDKAPFAFTGKIGQVRVNTSVRPRR
jgi:hypothetical protein